MLEVARTYAGLAAEHFEYPIQQWPGAPYLQLMSIGFFIDEDLLVYHAMVLRGDPEVWSEPVFFGNFTELPNEWFHDEMIKERFKTDVDTFKTQDFLRSFFDGPIEAPPKSPEVTAEEASLAPSDPDVQ